MPAGTELAREPLIRRRFSVSAPVGYLLEQRSIRATKELVVIGSNQSLPEVETRFKGLFFVHRYMRGDGSY